MDPASLVRDHRRLLYFCLPADRSLILVRHGVSPDLGMLIARTLLWLVSSDPHRLVDSDDAVESGRWFVAFFTSSDAVRARELRCPCAADRQFLVRRDGHALDLCPWGTAFADQPSAKRTAWRLGCISTAGRA